MLLAALLAALSPVLPHVFSGDPAVHARLTAGLLILAVMQFPGAIAFAFDGALIGGARRALAGPPGDHQSRRVRPTGHRHVPRAEPRSGRVVGRSAGLDDDASPRQLAPLGVTAVAAGKGIEASSRRP